jgi:hypothetical protein
MDRQDDAAREAVATACRVAIKIGRTFHGHNMDAVIADAVVQATIDLDEFEDEDAIENKALRILNRG